MLFRSCGHRAAGFAQQRQRIGDAQAQQLLMQAVAEMVARQALEVAQAHAHCSGDLAHGQIARGVGAQEGQGAVETLLPGLGVAAPGWKLRRHGQQGADRRSAGGEGEQRCQHLGGQRHWIGAQHRQAGRGRGGIVFQDHCQAVRGIGGGQGRAGGEEFAAPRRSGGLGGQARQPQRPGGDAHAALDQAVQAVQTQGGHPVGRQHARRARAQGEGVGNFMCYGDLPERSMSDPASFYIPSGVILNRDLSKVEPVDLNDPSKGTIPFRRYYADPTTLQVRKARDRNYAFYLQDGVLTVKLPKSESCKPRKISVQAA